MPENHYKGLYIRAIIKRYFKMTPKTFTATEQYLHVQHSILENRRQIKRIKIHVKLG